MSSLLSCNFAEDLDAVAATEMEADVHTTRKTSTELREKVVHGVRGLMESWDRDTLPHLTADVAQCYHVVDSDSGQDGQDAEVAQLLTSRNVINWCRTTKPLVPLPVHDRETGGLPKLLMLTEDEKKLQGPGNCLDVAGSVVLWGVDDLATLLRRLIYMSLDEFGISKFYQRWRKQFNVACQAQADMFSRSDRDWEQLVKSARPRHEELEMESAVTIPLSENIQIFVLANVLRRPIIVLSNSRDMPQSTTLFERDCIVERADSTSNLQDVGGIYLPLLWKPEDCIHYPVVLGNIAGRFVPLVGQRGGLAEFQSALDIIPVVTSQLEPLRIWFLLDEEEQEAYSLQQQYLNVTEVNLTRTHSIDMVLGARMRYEQLETAAAAVVTGPVSPVPPGLNVLLESQQARQFPSMALPPGDLVSMEKLPVAGTNPLHSVSRKRRRTVYSTKHIREQRKRRKNAAAATPSDDKHVSRQELKSRVLGFIADHIELDWDTAGPDEVGGPWKQLAKFIHGPRARRNRAKYFCTNYRRKSNNWLLRKDSEPLKGRRASLVNTKVSDDDNASSSLNEYGDNRNIDAGKLTEGGSFIGDYGTKRSRRGAGRINDSAVVLT